MSERGDCTCANDGSAVRCPMHTQADYDAQRDERAGLSEAEGKALGDAWLYNDVNRGVEWLTPVVERILHERLAAAIARAEAAEARVAAVAKVHGEYFDLDREPFDDASPEPEDVWRFDRDLRAALTPPATDQPASAGGA